MSYSDIKTLTSKEIAQYHKAFREIKHEQFELLAYTIRVAINGDSKSFESFLSSLRPKQASLQIHPKKQNDFDVKIYEEVPLG